MANRYRQRTIRRLLAILFLATWMFCLWLGQISPLGWQTIAIAQSPPPSQLVQQGVELYQQGDYQNAIARWQTALKIYQDTKNPTNETIVLENLARANQQIGKIDEAIRYWDRVIANYRQQGDFTQVGRMLTEQAQAYSNLGQSRKAIALLCGASLSNGDCQEGSALQIAKQQKDPVGEAAALGSLGEAYRQRGDYDLAIKYLEMAQKIGNSDYQSRVLNSLGNARTSRSQLWNLRANSAQQRGNKEQQQKFQQQADRDRQQALQDFQSSFQLAREQDDKPSQMRSLLNLIQLNYRSPQANLPQTITFDEAVQQALVLLDKLPDTPSKVYAAIDLANLPTLVANITSPLTQCPTEKKLSDIEAKKLLELGIKIAQNLKDLRAESFAKGALAHVYECQEQFDKALKLNREALWTADQNLLFQDSLYFWEWQAGRIYNKQGKQLEAIAAYQRAFQVLEKVRSDLILAERDLQFDFRDLIDPLYRQLAELRLRLTSLSSLPPAERQRELTNAVATIDALKLAELQNYFGNDCNFNIIAAKNVDELIGKNTAVFSSIIFNDGVAIVLTLPNNEKKWQWIPQDSKTFRETIRKFRQGLEKGRRAINYDPQEGKKLYDWIVRPFESDLNRERIDTLVFIQDGVLRTIPMAALYDGKQFLIEKYAIATTPSLRLTADRTLNSQPNRALILGVTQPAKVDEQTFDALANVPGEITAVQQLLPDSKLLVDESFDRDRLTTELDRDTYPIIHLATHAQFGTIPADTFIVTGNNNKLTINELETALRRTRERANAIELLTLTACQTAVGDERSTLGLAGVAAQAGVRSTLASLWSVEDESTSQLITEFYRQLKSGVGKAKALQIAQVKLIKAKADPEINDQYDHPGFWASFILIGNWA